MWTVKLPNSPSTSTSWQLRPNPGTAKIRTWVRSGPIPDRLTAAKTFRFAGNPRQASRADPKNSSCSWSSPSNKIPRSCKKGAPSQASGGLREVITTRSTLPRQADFMPSRPAMAPDGAKSRHPVLRDRSKISGCSRRAPTLITIKSLPAPKASRASCGTTCPPAVSTTRSAQSIRSFSPK